MLTLFAVLLLFVPTLFQYIVGNKSLAKAINIKFGFVCLISIILQFGITILSFILVIHDITSSGSKCATGAIGIFFIGFIATVCTLIAMLIQFLNRKTYS